MLSQARALRIARNSCSARANEARLLAQLISGVGVKMQRGKPLPRPMQTWQRPSKECACKPQSENFRCHSSIVSQGTGRQSLAPQHTGGYHSCANSITATISAWLFINQTPSLLAIADLIPRIRALDLLRHLKRALDHAQHLFRGAVAMLFVERGETASNGTGNVAVCRVRLYDEVVAQRLV